jgi:hypothetical protein
VVERGTDFWSGCTSANSVTSQRDKLWSLAGLNKRGNIDRSKPAIAQLPEYLCRKAHLAMCRHTANVFPLYTHIHGDPLYRYALSAREYNKTFAGPQPLPLLPCGRSGKAAAIQLLSLGPGLDGLNSVSVKSGCVGSAVHGYIGRYAKNRMAPSAAVLRRTQGVLREGARTLVELWQCTGVTQSYATHIANRGQGTKRTLYETALTSFFPSRTRKPQIFPKPEILAQTGIREVPIPRLIVSPGPQEAVIWGRSISLVEHTTVTGSNSEAYPSIKGLLPTNIATKYGRKINRIAQRYNVPVNDLVVYCFDGSGWDNSLSRELRIHTEVAAYLAAFGPHHRVGKLGLKEYLLVRMQDAYFYYKDLLKVRLVDSPRLSGTSDTSWSNKIVNWCIHYAILVLIFKIPQKEALDRALIEGDDSLFVLLPREAILDIHLHKVNALLFAFGIQPTSTLAPVNSACPGGGLIGKIATGHPEFVSRFFYCDPAQAHVPSAWRAMHSPFRVGLKPFFARTDEPQKAVNIAVSTACASLKYLYGNLPIHRVMAEQVIKHFEKLQTREEYDSEFLYKVEFFGLLDINPDVFEFEQGVATLKQSCATTHQSPIKWLDAPPSPDTVTQLERSVYARITGITISEQHAIERELETAWDLDRCLLHYFPVLRNTVHKLKLVVNPSPPHQAHW